MQHILICPFGRLGKNIMPLPGMDGERESGRRAKVESEVEQGRFGGKTDELREAGIKRGKDDRRRRSPEEGMKPGFSRLAVSPDMISSHQRGQQGFEYS